MVEAWTERKRVSQHGGKFGKTERRCIRTARNAATSICGAGGIDRRGQQSARSGANDAIEFDRLLFGRGESLSRGRADKNPLEKRWGDVRKRRARVARACGIRDGRDFRGRPSGTTTHSGLMAGEGAQLNSLFLYPEKLIVCRFIRPIWAAGGER